ncbi:radical SAM/SPASM domain-containing protein [Elusimicrobiota bacterium]
MEELWKTKKTNGALISFHLKKKKIRLSSYPSCLVIDITDFCNLNCPFCPNKRISHREKKENTLMASKDFKKIIDMLGAYLTEIVFGDKWEPVLNRDIYDMLLYSKKHKIRTVLSTNFSGLTEGDIRNMITSGLDYINVSIDGATQESYSKYRIGGDLNTVLDNLRLLIKLKKELKLKNPVIEWQYLVFKHNQAEIAKAREIAIDMNVDRISFVPANIYDFEKNYKEWLPTIEEYAKYKIIDEQEDVKWVYMDKKDNCYAPWHTLAINADGDIFPCCGEERTGYEWGNIFNMDFNEIWNSKNYIELRKYLLFRKAAGGHIPCKKCLNI